MKIILCVPCLMLAAAPPLYAETTSPAAGGFEPIPVHAIRMPGATGGTADEQLATGQVSEETYPMAAPATRRWRIAFLFPHLKDPYWIGCDYGVISEAKRLGVIADIFPADGYDDLLGQLRKMDEAIAARYDAIVISPVNLASANSAIARARARGIPVFELANDSTSDDLTLKVTTSMKAMGSDATAWVIRDAQRRGLKRINIALLPGPAGAGWVIGEVDGTREEARKAAIQVNIVDIRYGDSDRIGQSQLAAQLFAEHGKRIDYLLGCTGCAPAAILPLRQAGLEKKIRIVAYDLTREIVGLIRRGEIQAAADTKGVSQARIVINAAVNHLEQRATGAPHVMLVKLGMVDRDNHATYRFDTSTAPDGYVPVLSYSPPGTR